MLSPGELIRRTELHKLVGGRRQGGIGPSSQTPNVLIFSENEVGQVHGYRDGWDPHGVFHYTGEGQRGDQQFKHGNRAVRDHAAEGRHLRLFQGASGIVQYVGEVRLAIDDPWYLEDAPETGGGPLRRVIIFRLVPVGDISTHMKATIEEAPPTRTVESTELEAHHTDSFEITPNSEILQGARREPPLLHRYAAHLTSLGHVVRQHRYWPVRHGRALRCDAFDESAGVLIESKASASREAIRMAIGQLLDYAELELERPKALTVLVPSEPRSDLVALLHAVGMSAVYPAGAGWVTTTAPPSDDGPVQYFVPSIRAVPN